MSDWLHDLPVPVMALVIFGFTYLIAAAILLAVVGRASEARTRSFKSISPGLLPSLSIIFGLFVAFTAAQVWGDNDRANVAIGREASALRSALVFTASFPEDSRARLRGLIETYVRDTARVEWPKMAHQTAQLNTTPPALAEALQLVLTLSTTTAGAQTAQHEITSAIETALDARRQRIIVSLAEVNAVKWWCLYLQAACVLLTIALLHCDDRVAAMTAMALFATGAAAAVLLIAAHDRPFIGQLSIQPDALLQILPDGAR